MSEPVPIPQPAVPQPLELKPQIPVPGAPAPQQSYAGTTPGVPRASFIGAQRTVRSTHVIHQGGKWVFIVGAALLALALVAGGTVFAYERYLENKKGDLEQKISALETGLEQDVLKLSSVSSSLQVAKDLLAKHTFASNALVLLHQATHPKVQLSNFSFSQQEGGNSTTALGKTETSGGTIDVNGSAASFQVVSEQVRVLESLEQVQKVDFGGLSRAEKGLVSFKLTIVFKPSLLLLKFESATTTSQSATTTPAGTGTATST